MNIPRLFKSFNPPSRNSQLGSPASRSEAGMDSEDWFRFGGFPLRRSEWKDSTGACPERSRRASTWSFNCLFLLPVIGLLLFCHSPAFGQIPASDDPAYTQLRVENLSLATRLKKLQEELDKLRKAYDGLGSEYGNLRDNYEKLY